MRRPRRGWTPHRAVAASRFGNTRAHLRRIRVLLGWLACHPALLPLPAAGPGSTG